MKSRKIKGRVVVEVALAGLGILIFCGWIVFIVIDMWVGLVETDTAFKIAITVWLSIILLFVIVGIVKALNAFYD